jgi:hypothetical protein
MLFRRGSQSSRGWKTSRICEPGLPRHSSSLTTRKRRVTEPILKEKGKKEEGEEV